MCSCATQPTAFRLAIPRPNGKSYGDQIAALTGRSLTIVTLATGPRALEPSIAAKIAARARTS
jgi:hypothetical protein